MNQTINTLIFVIGTFFSVLEGIHLSGIWKQRLPEHTVPHLEQFARMSVQKVEQTGSNLSPESKNAQAESDIIYLCNHYKIPVPSKRAMQITIESAVLLLPKTGNL